MNILCVHLGFARCLTELGHTVLDLHPPAGCIALGPRIGDFVPDLLIQQETLGARTVLMDLDGFSCPKVFWSIDTHLNSFWHRYYARLFDLFCTTQKHWLAWFADRGITSHHWLPWHGHARQLVPWERRTQDLVFVGRVTPERPVRGWFLEMLRELEGARIEQSLGHEAMLSLYEHSRRVPNESIFGEVNFRLFEAASCGCAVLNPAIPGVEELFVPGEEVALFRDGAELEALLRQMPGHSQKARLMGLQAWERVRREHLPEHRVRSLMERARDLSPAARRDISGRIALWLAIFHLWEAGRTDLSRNKLEEVFFSLPSDDEVLAVLLRLRSCAGRDEFMQLAIPVAQTGQYAESRGVNLAGSMGALQHGDVALSRLFFLRHMRCGQSLSEGPEENPVSICLAWSRELQRCGDISRPGFVFNPQVHLPGSALECLVLASVHDPENRAIYRLISQILSRTVGWEALRMQALSYVGLRERDNWRLGLELGVANCRAFRVRQGVQELLLAEALARSVGDESRFTAALAGMDSSGQIAVLLRVARPAHNPSH